MSEASKRTEPTKEELAKYYQDYYKWLDILYPIKSFEISGKDGKKLSFFNGFNIDFEDEKKSGNLAYHLKELAYEEAFEEEKKLNLLGESYKRQKHF